MEPLVDSRDPIRILIAVAVRLYRDGLAATLNAQRHLSIQATAATACEARDAARVIQPDVIIVDVSFDDIFDLIRGLRMDAPKSRILVFAVREEINSILEYAEAGADGFATASGSLSELIEAIERTAAGELLCSPRLAAQLLRRAAHPPNRPSELDGHLLSGRELQVFALLKQGRSNKEISAALNIAEATVKNHVHHLLEKLQVSTRAQAIAGAHRP